MHLALIGQVLGQGQRGARGHDTLDRGIVCQVKEHCHAREGAAFGEGAPEVIGYIVFDTHRCKDDGELLGLCIRFGACLFSQGCLAHDLRSQLVVGQTGA